MNPHSKPRPLFFTPRSPWGGRLQHHSFHRHMRASEDEKQQKNPNLLQKIGNAVSHAVSNAQPFFGTEVGAGGGDPVSGSVLAGVHWGKKNTGISAASDEEARENRIRAENQSWGMKVPAGEPESSHQEPAQQVTTDQELEAAQREWAKKNAGLIDPKVEAARARFRAAEAARARANG